MASASTGGNTKTKILYYSSDGDLSTQSRGGDKKNETVKIETKISQKIAFATMHAVKDPHAY